MASAAEFLSDVKPKALAPKAAPLAAPAAPTAAAAPTVAAPATKPVAGAKRSAKDFLASGKKPAEQAKEEDPDYLTEVGNTFGDTVSNSFSQLQDDWAKSQGEFASQEAMDKWKALPAWGKVKSEFEGLVATGMLPLDAFNALISPVWGAGKAGIAKPIAKGLMYPTKPIREFMRSHSSDPKHFPTEAQVQDQTEENLMMLGTMFLPVKSAGARATAATAREEAAARGATAPEPKSVWHNLIMRPIQSAEDFAKEHLRGKLKKEGVTKEEATAKMKKKGAAMVDLGPPGGGVVDSAQQAGLAGEGRRLGWKLFRTERKVGRRGRVNDAVQNMTNDKNMFEFLDELDEGRRTGAKPLYDEAFKAGSSAPLRVQFEVDFNAASRSAAEAQKAVNDAETAITSLESKHRGVGDNVYGNASRNEDLAKATKARDEAQAKLQQAETARSDALERLQVAQEQERTGQRGGVWSPRIQQFLDNKYFKPGLKRGIEIQEMEALRDGVPFNLTDYGITGFDAVGDPIVSKVPNMRLLDAAKRGVDAILRKEATNPLTKAFEPDELQRAQVGALKEFVAELDRLTDATGAGGKNSPYRKAREIWSGPSAQMEAVHDGLKFDKLEPEQITKRKADMTAHEREAYVIGVTRKIANEVTAGTRDALRVAQNIVDDEHYQRQLKAAVGDEHFAHLHEMAEREVDYAARDTQILGGSQTQHLREGSKEFESLGGGYDEIKDAVLGSLSGFANPHAWAMRTGAKWASSLLEGMTEARREALAKLLFSTNEADNMAAIEMLYEEDRISTPEAAGPSKRSLAPLAGAAQGQFQQQQRDQQMRENPPQ